MYNIPMIYNTINILLYEHMLIIYIPLYWRFPEDGDLSHKRLGCFTVIDNLQFYKIYVHMLVNLESYIKLTTRQKESYCELCVWVWSRSLNNWADKAPIKQLFRWLERKK